MTTDDLDKFLADSTSKGYDEALVLAGQMSSAHSHAHTLQKV